MTLLKENIPALQDLSPPLDENVAQGLPRTGFQVGINDVDPGNYVGQLLPYGIDPEVSWIERQCWVETYLDSGMVTHNPLPQSIQPVDSLGGLDFDDEGFAESTDGPVTESEGKFTNIVQRMANSKYRFCLKGWAWRAGYTIPIPKITTFAGVAVTPDDDPPQKVIGPICTSNNNGVPVFYAQWQLWYTVSVPPKEEAAIPPNISEFIDADAELPKFLAAPLPVKDPDALNTGPSYFSQGLEDKLPNNITQILAAP